MAVDTRAGEHVAGDEQPGDHERRNQRELADGARALARLLRLAGQEVDGPHQSSIPRPTATAMDALETPSLPSSPRATLTRVSGSATRTGMPMSRSSSGASPPQAAAPPVMRISTIPSDFGCSW